MRLDVKENTKWQPTKDLTYEKKSMCEGHKASQCY
jgi:hypothetical protein